MSDDARDSARSLDGIRAEIVKRLRTRRSEIVQTIYARIQDDVPDWVDGQDRAYHAGVLAAVAAVLSYSLEAIEHGSAWSGPIPPDAVAQARRAARTGVSLGIVVRRYVAGHGEFGDFVMNEAQRCGLSSNVPALDHMRKTQEAILGHLTAAIEHEYEQEREQVVPERRRSDIVRRLLSDETVDPAEMAELHYEIHTSWHIGLMATGAGVEEVLRELKARYGRRLLVTAIDGRVWAWLGGQKRFTAADIDCLSSNGHVGLLLAIGEPGKGIDGWRLTHNQAQEALGLALSKPDGFARYADDPLLVVTANNDTLAKSLTQKYLIPLRSQRDGGATLRQTLRTYIDLGCNATSAAHPLKVGRRAVVNRVRMAETLIGRSIRECLTELDTALRMEQLERDGRR
jgi:PucR C-terminal helix-turn-helix domain